MENLRILAENIDQKNEIISMLVSIGYNRESTWSYDNDDLMGIHVYEDGDIQDVIIGDYCDKDHKEITIQQLRDMVVLKRNDVNDRNVIDPEYTANLYLDSKGELFVFHIPTQSWKISNLNGEEVVMQRLKPIEEKVMKEFLVKQGDKWTLQLLDSDTEENSYRVAVPSGADFLTQKLKGDKSFWADGGRLWFCSKFNKWVELGSMQNHLEKLKHELLWQRSEDFTKVTIDELKHRVYKKDVSHLDSIDVYRVLELFNVQSHAVGHAIKKLLCSGGRGAKDEAQDIQEAIDSLIRYQEMKNEDE